MCSFAGEGEPVGLCLLNFGRRSGAVAAILASACFVARSRSSTDSVAARVAGESARASASTSSKTSCLTAEMEYAHTPTTNAEVMRPVRMFRTKNGRRARCKPGEMPCGCGEDVFGLTQSAQKKDIRSPLDDMMLAQPRVIYTGLIVTSSAGATEVEDDNRFEGVSYVQFTQIDKLHVHLPAHNRVYSGISLGKACVNLRSHSGSNIVW